ncbi:MAG: peptidase domain-containing ABC transporter [Magnetococcales bacterium]|nr:peptidase domain-containing ABC transporter [Magnetococcales bacterium]
MLPLLKAVGYRGDLRHVAEALPHFVEQLDLTGLRNMMGNLTYASYPMRGNLPGIDTRLAPFLFVPFLGAAMVVLRMEEDHILIFDGSDAKLKQIPLKPLLGTAYFFKPVDHEQLSSHQARTGWFRMITERFRRLVYYMLSVTFVITLMQVATPLFTMAVYDRVVGSKSVTTLTFLVLGILTVVAFDWVLRSIRSRMILFVGARMDSIVGNAIFMRILSLPPVFTERAPIGSQVSRIKDFDSVREFFTGPLAMVFVELPFVVVFLIVIAVVAGPLAFIPMVTMVLFGLLWMVSMPILAAENARARRAGSKRQEFIVESLTKMRALKYSAMEDMWLDRFRDLAATASMGNFRTAVINAVVSSVSQILVVGSGVATIATGVFRVLSGDMSTGALVATMALVWRVLSPMQSLFVAMTRLEQIQSSVSQIDNLMNVKPEQEMYSPIEPIPEFTGKVDFVRVSLRYTPEAEPALMGASFEVQPGQIVACIGRNGSGKSTVIKLIAGLYHPQAGSIRIDDIDIRQMSPVELRHSVAYVPQTCSLFYGTIAQNLRLSHATASDEELEEACRMVDLWHEIQAMPKGMWTRIGGKNTGSLPSSMMQKISLARAFVKPAKIMLFDEPGNTLDWEGDQAFMRAAKSLRGKNTMFLVTHRPSHIRMADQIIFLDQGYVRLAGPREEVEPQIPKDLM